MSKLEKDSKIIPLEPKLIKKEVNFRINRKLKCKHQDHYKKSGDKKMRNFVEHICIQPECLKDILMCSNCQTDKNIANFIHASHEKMQVSDFLESIAEGARSSSAKSLEDNLDNDKLFNSKLNIKNDVDKIRESIEDIKGTIENCLNKNTNDIISLFENTKSLEMKNCNLKFKYLFDILDEKTPYENVENLIVNLKEILKKQENISKMNAGGISKKLQILQAFKEKLIKLMEKKFNGLIKNLFSSTEIEDLNVDKELKKSKSNIIDVSNEMTGVISNLDLKNKNNSETFNTNNENQGSRGLDPSKEFIGTNNLERIPHVKTEFLENPSININNQNHSGTIIPTHSNISEQAIKMNSVANNPYASIKQTTLTQKFSKVSPISSENKNIAKPNEDSLVENHLELINQHNRIGSIKQTTLTQTFPISEKKNIDKPNEDLLMQDDSELTSQHNHINSLLENDSELVNLNPGIVDCNLSFNSFGLLSQYSKILESNVSNNYGLFSPRFSQIPNLLQKEVNKPENEIKSIFFSVIF